MITVFSVTCFLGGVKTAAAQDNNEYFDKGLGILTQGNAQQKEKFRSLLGVKEPSETKPSEAERNEVRQIDQPKSKTEAKKSPGLQLKMMSPAERSQKIFAALMTKDAQTTFKIYIADPIPNTVIIVEGKSVHWLDSMAYLIFDTDLQTFRQVSKEYREVSISEVERSVDPLKRFKVAISQIPGIVCYKKEKYGPSDYYLCWDDDKGRAYFNY